MQHQYGQHLKRFENFCREEGASWPPKRCGEFLADFLDLEFIQGKASSEGEKLVAAVEYKFASLRGKLVHSRRALKGWRKERPASSRLPLPRLICHGMAMIMVAAGKRLRVASEGGQEDSTNGMRSSSEIPWMQSPTRSERSTAL